jgi:hypothetical protein
LGYRVTALAATKAAGITIAAGCADGTVRLLAAASKNARSDWASAHVLTGHAHGITAMSFDPAGRWLATASRDGTVRLWDLATRSAVTVLAPPQASAVRVGSTGNGPDGGPDGWAAAVASTDGTWHGLSSTDSRIWMAEGLERLPLPEPPAVPPMTPAPPTPRSPSPPPSARRRSRG